MLIVDAGSGFRYLFFRNYVRGSVSCCGIVRRGGGRVAVRHRQFSLPECTNAFVAMDKRVSVRHLPP